MIKKYTETTCDWCDESEPILTTTVIDNHVFDICAGCILAIAPLTGRGTLLEPGALLADTRDEEIAALKATLVAQKEMDQVRINALQREVDRLREAQYGTTMFPRAPRYTLSQLNPSTDSFSNTHLINS